MTTEAVDAPRADHASLAALATELAPSEWSAPSTREGWSVLDVVAHMTQFFRQVVDPTSLPPRDPPQMNADDLARLDVPLALHLTGPGGRSVAVGPGGSAQADVWSSTADFVLWATKREDWRQVDVRIAGDETTAERFCDTIRVF